MSERGGVYGIIFILPKFVSKASASIQTLVLSTMTGNKLFLIQFTLLSNSSVGKESACSAEDPTSIPGSGRAPGEGIGYPLSVLGLPVWLSW